MNKKSNYFVFSCNLATDFKKTIMIKRISISLMLLCLIRVSIFATGENLAVGGKAAGMSNASVTLIDFWSVNQNQAGMAWIKNFSAGVYYENRFGIKELGLKSGAIVMPTKSGVLGLSVSNFGYSQFNENKIGLAYAKNFGEKFSAGVQLDYLTTHIGENYGNSGTVAAEAGLHYKLNSKLTAGAHVFNPTRAKVAEYNDERAPTIFKLGLSYTFSDKLIVAIESEKDIQYEPVMKAGVEYHPIQTLYFRTGISSNPTMNSFGFGLELSNFNIDFATSYHRTLGFSPQVSLVFHVNKNVQPSKQ